MKLTKYKHACFTVEIDERILVVDPGELSPDFTVTNNIDAVVVTHAHVDHFNLDTLTKIHDNNPDAVILSTAEVIEKLGDLPSKIIQADEHVTIGPLHLDFYGGKHQAVHSSIPPIDNISLMVNNKIYYPGDSFYQPEMKIDTLAVPLGAPWLKTAESIDFLVALKPRFAFPTHDETLSKAGKGFANNLVSHFASENGVQYVDISGQTIEL